MSAGQLQQLNGLTSLRTLTISPPRLDLAEDEFIRPSQESRNDDSIPIFVSVAVLAASAPGKALTTLDLSDVRSDFRNCPALMLLPNLTSLNMPIWINEDASAEQGWNTEQAKRVVQKSNLRSLIVNW